MRIKQMSELYRQPEVLGLLEYWCPKFGSKEQVVERIRADKGITEEVQREAHSQLGEYWPAAHQSRRQLLRGSPNLCRGATPRRGV